MTDGVLYISTAVYVKAKILEAIDLFERLAIARPLLSSIDRDWCSKGEGHDLGLAAADLHAHLLTVVVSGINELL
jgi:hypothetical protein